MASHKIDQYRVAKGVRVAYFADYHRACRWLDRESPETGSATRTGYVVRAVYTHDQYGTVAEIVHGSPISA